MRQQQFKERLFHAEIPPAPTVAVKPEKDGMKEDSQKIPSVNTRRKAFDETNRLLESAKNAHSR